MDTAEDTRLEKVEVRLCAFRTLEPNLLLDLCEFELDELRVRVAFAVQVSEDFEGFFMSVVADKPTRTLKTTAKFRKFQVHM